MELAEIKELISVMRRNKIKEIDLEQADTKLRIVSATDPRPKQDPPAPAQQVLTPVYLPQEAQAAVAQTPVPHAAAPAAAAPQAAATPQPPEEDANAGLLEIKSPMVGTFYRAPAPEAPPYTDVGKNVSPDAVVCIVEAMKLMNEIKAEVSGRITKILVENGQPVEYNQPLFLVDPKG